MLGLRSATTPEWIDRALRDFDEVLLDHAHCERKAASTALSLIFKYTDSPALLVPLSELAREELAHFELVVAEIRARGGEFRRQRPSPYAGRLLEACRSAEPDRLIDTLLCCSLIEARSCERMQLLADVLPEDRLRRLYRGLLESEARHHTTYVRLAETLTDRADVRTRLAELAAHEAEVIATAPQWPRMHC